MKAAPETLNTLDLPRAETSGPLAVLNLYAGLGGNRKLWEDVAVTAVERDPKIAAIYQQQFPNDTVIVADAHEYLLKNFTWFDFIWSSPPCQSHSRMAKATRHPERKFPDLGLYEEIIFLRNFFRGAWLVENVRPYYEPLIPPNQVSGRHIFWSNFYFLVEAPASPPNFINESTVAGKEALQKWLGIYYDGNVYYQGNHCPAQILRNCVHPLVGKSILDGARRVIISQQKGD